MPPDVSVVIVSYNTRDLLRACLRSVVANPSHLLYREDSVGTHSDVVCCEVFVVDNASSDSSAAMVREEFPQVHLVESPRNLGFAAATNVGLRQAMGRYLLLLNPDAELLGDALPAMVRFLDSHPRVAAVGPRLIYADGRRQHSAFRFPTLAQVLMDLFPLHGRLLDSRLNGRYPPATRPHPIDHPLGACMLISREALVDVGLLDEGFFMYCEEVDWCLRARKKGWEVYHIPEALAVHHAGQSTGQRRNAMLVQLYASRLRLYRKHYSRLFLVVASVLTRLGMWAEMRRARRLASSGVIGEADLKSRLEACREIDSMYATAMGGSRREDPR